MTMEHKKICFIGAGNMARSIISGLVSSGYPANCIQASNPSYAKLDALQQDFSIKITDNNIEAAIEADIILLCVKPQIMKQVCEQMQQVDLSNKLIITIAAGIISNRYQEYFNQNIRLIRAMPNTPTQIGYGMTGLWASEQVNENEKKLADIIMSAGGKAVWLTQEDELNMVIALAGSSPAYFFLFIESMIKTAQTMGMDEQQARALAQQAALGAAEMVIQNPAVSLETLRHNVTSKGGTTAKAIETFEQGKLDELVGKAMKNCIKRAEEMAKTF